MKSVDDTIKQLLNGASIDDAVAELLDERVVCRYVGSPKRLKRRGRIYYQRSRMCTGQADPERKRKAAQAWISGGTRTRARYSQQMRWRNFKPKPMRHRQLQGRRKSR